MKIAIDAKTAAAEAIVYVNTWGLRPVKITQKGLSGSETIAIHEECSPGQYQPHVDDTPLVLSVTKTSVLLEGPGNYKIVKGVTAAAVTVSVNPGNVRE